MASIVSAQQLHKTYRRGSAPPVEALRGVDLEIESGEVVAIMGPSGSGKSTLLHLLGCLDTPTSGRLLLDGQPVFSLPRRQLPQLRNHLVGFMFQRHHLIASLTACENVMLPLRYGGRPLAKARQRANDLLQIMHLDDRGNHRPLELSGGEQARVALARALANSPAIILADEPTGELDSATGTAVLDLLTRLNQEQGQTIILVTHDAQVADRCQRVLQMSDGRLLS